MLDAGLRGRARPRAGGPCRWPRGSRRRTARSARRSVRPGTTAASLAAARRRRDARRYDRHPARRRGFPDRRSSATRVVRFAPVGSPPRRRSIARGDPPGPHVGVATRSPPRLPAPAPPARPGRAAAPPVRSCTGARRARRAGRAHGHARSRRPLRERRLLRTGRRRPRWSRSRPSGRGRSAAPGAGGSGRVSRSGCAAAGLREGGRTADQRSSRRPTGAVRAGGRPWPGPPRRTAPGCPHRPRRRAAAVSSVPAGTARKLLPQRFERLAMAQHVNVEAIAGRSGTQVPQVAAGPLDLGQDVGLVPARGGIGQGGKTREAQLPAPEAGLPESAAGLQRYHQDVLAHRTGRVQHRPGEHRGEWTPARGTPRSSIGASHTASASGRVIALKRTRSSRRPSGSRPSRAACR